MNQKLNAVRDILTSLEKDRELSFNEYSKILVKQRLNDDSFQKIKAKYYWIDSILEWVSIITSLWNKSIDYILKKNLYKKTSGKINLWIQNFRWTNLENWSFYTIFKIYNWEDFITSLFSYIDSIKTSETDVISLSNQKLKINQIFEKIRNNFWKDSFSFEMPINKYFSDKICYYRVMSQIPCLEIRNITIFNWIIRFSITINDSEPTQNKEITWEKKGIFLYMRYSWKEKKFKVWKNTYYIIKESLERWVNEHIDFIEMVDKLIWKENEDEMKKVYNAIGYANSEIIKELWIKDFFLVEEKAYKRQYKVVEL